MAHRVNLDALIPREDFEIMGSPRDDQSDPPGWFRLFEMEKGQITRMLLRKPDFQRETNHWDPDKVADLVQCFLETELIPSLILWRSPSTGNIFVIDGAHRLSALIAWTHDDYGDGETSRAFFGNRIPLEQQKGADAARKIIHGRIGTYPSVRLALERPDTSTLAKVRWAKNLPMANVRLQWVTGDAEKAERSFRAINMKATPIDKTEMRMIDDRRKPNALAARALVHAGTGHKYWSGFSEDTQREIERIARETYDLLFVPELQEPVRTLDLPVAGRPYSAESVKLIFDFVDFANRDRRKAGPERIVFGSRSKIMKPVQDDKSGAETLEYLRSVRRIVGRITGTQPGSLGLHPAVYYYSATGKRQPTAFLAAVSFVEELEHHKAIPTFTEHRRDFEEFLLTYKHFINQIIRRYGSEERGLRPIVDMYQTVFSGVIDGLGNSEIVDKLRAHGSLRFLQDQVDEEGKPGQDFTRDVKSAAFLQTAISTAVRCSICVARIPTNSITIDHRVRKEDGGSSALENADVSHPYCNTGYKESLHANV